ncbi:glutathione-disulfide reductase [Motiliproteus coralliicola]|uniref:Glutathione reductase n=1 Tax=Motiliproteus coralliicola TaxID=2283196 RepID=A0A369WR02_9GAMM|nr:glutathione-disulfide reductase [Motiliproteus coralliicola]RDE24528.1 glutathione-disulfide reductase [Motiliproteus coralliicola]
MSNFDFDLFVIGAGSGGVRAARMAAAKGVRVAVAEDRYMGGTCVNVGCVPKKLYVYASQYSEQIEESRGFGWDAAVPAFDWNRLRDNKKAEISRLNGIYNNLLDNSGAEVLNGRATVVGPNQVEVNGNTYSAERILVATGGWPTVPAIEGAEHALTSNEIFDMEQFPQRILIVGGGYIAVEFAGIFNGLGAKTTQLYRGELFLRGFDNQVRSFVAEEMRKKGVDLRFNLNVESIQKLEDGTLSATLTDGSTIETDAVLYATGRKPNVNGLGLESVGVSQAKDGSIEVDQNFRSSVESIYAIGDVINRVQLTPVALAEGMQLVEHLYGEQQRQVSYELIPTAVFSQPNIGTVGPSEEQAVAQYPNLDVYQSEFRAMKHTLSGLQERTLMKLLVDADTDRVVGAHMVGPDAGEITQGLGIALKAGATKAVFDSTIGIHPTAAEEFVTMRDTARRYRGGQLQS